MAAANESQGLKIAVAAFITLTVILTVSSYFLYSNGASAEARREQAEENANTKSKAASEALNRVEEMRNKIGVKATEHDPAKEEIAAHFKKVDERLNTLARAGERGGAEGPGERRSGHRSSKKPSRTCRGSSPRFDPSPTRRISRSMDRMSELMDNLSLLTHRAVAQLREREAQSRVVHRRLQERG